MEIVNKAKQLFTFSKRGAEVPVEEQNQKTKQEGETYKQYGFRSAGLANGSAHSLPPCLQSIYLSLRKEQENDAHLQERLRRNQRTEIANKESEKEQTENELTLTEKRIQSIEDEIKECERNIDDAKTAGGNPQAKTQLWITGILLIPFTIYFFIFYSSVAYSAFFQSFDLNNIGEDGNVSLSAAIFNGRAFTLAWQDGFTEMLFILFMPIIFLAFGYILNRWEQEKGKLKFFKIPAIILVAFIFDTLLAYEICEKMYELQRQMLITEMPVYSMSMAIVDPRFWVIICLGFVAYLIWGITFGYFMKALNNLKTNIIYIERLKNTMEDKKSALDKEKDKQTCLKNKIVSLQNEVQNLQLHMEDYSRYDLGRIKLELNNFYSGWLQYLAALGRNANATADANEVFDRTLKEFRLV